MLYLLFQVRDESYAVSARQVVEVVPAAKLRKQPKAPEFIAGLLNWHGTGVPVLDLCALFASGACARTMSSRIVLVNYRDGRGDVHVLGLFAENVVETLECDDTRFAPSGIKNPLTPWLGDVVTQNERLVQRVEVDRLLPQNVRDALFT